MKKISQIYKSLKERKWFIMKKKYKNQIIIYVIAFMLVTAGYLNYSEKKVVEVSSEDNQNRSDENILLFLHIREPKEITRAVLRFNAKTILITRSSIHKITSNLSDKNVFNYNYDYVIENNGTLDDLKDKAKKFIKNLEE